jgi:alkaline phosphatase D
MLRGMRRREFLSKTTAGVGGAVMAPGALLRASQSASTLFTLGVASGDPAPGSVILWTRLAPDPLNGGGMPPVPVLVRWRVALDAGMMRVVHSGLAIAWPQLAHSVHVDVGGLAPGTWYFYQFSVGSDESPVGRTRTLPVSLSAVDLFRFAFVSCQNWQAGFYPAYRHLAREPLDLVVHLGDYIYESGVDADAPRQHDSPQAFDLESYRNRYALYKSDPHLQAAHAAFPWLVVPDDHEVDNDYADANPEDNGDADAFLARRAQAYRAYYEHMPLRPRSFPIGPDMRLYRGLTVGDLLQISALDTRQYRTDQPCGGTIATRCAGALAPSQTMTGPEQEQWLLMRLDRSPAIWNVIAQQTMFAQFDFLAGESQVFLMDSWDGYVAARQRITSFLSARRPPNPIVITGDIHSSWVHEIKTNFDVPGSETVAVEIVGPSISSTFLPLAIPFVNAALADNPHTHFFDGLFHGYTKCTVARNAWLTEIRVVTTTTTDQAPAFTLAAFIVQSGQSSVQRA